VLHREGRKRRVGSHVDPGSKRTIRAIEEKLIASESIKGRLSQSGDQRITGTVLVSKRGLSNHSGSTGRKSGANRKSAEARHSQIRGRRLRKRGLEGAKDERVAITRDLGQARYGIGAFVLEGTLELGSSAADLTSRIGVAVARGDNA